MARAPSGPLHRNVRCGGGEPPGRSDTTQVAIARKPHPPERAAMAAISTNAGSRARSSGLQGFVMGAVFVLIAVMYAAAAAGTFAPAAMRALLRGVASRGAAAAARRRPAAHDMGRDLPLPRGKTPSATRPFGDHPDHLRHQRIHPRGTLTPDGPWPGTKRDPQMTQITRRAPRRDKPINVSGRSHYRRAARPSARHAPAQRPTDLETIWSRSRVPRPAPLFPGRRSANICRLLHPTRNIQGRLSGRGRTNRLGGARGS